MKKRVRNLERKRRDTVERGITNRDMAFRVVPSSHVLSLSLLLSFFVTSSVLSSVFRLSLSLSLDQSQIMPLSLCSSVPLSLTLSPALHIHVPHSFLAQSIPSRQMFLVLNPYNSTRTRLYIHQKQQRHQQR